MNMSATTWQLISLFVDGELDASEQQDVLALMQQSGASRTWDEYHLVGDLLRSTDMAGEIRPDFAASFSARLAAEPSYLGTGLALGRTSTMAAVASRNVSHSKWRRLAAPGAAVAAAVLLTVAAVPHLSGSHAWHAASDPAPMASNLTPAGSVMMSSGRATLRDARIDEYLQAHQRFSPSLYATAQYSRIATFATESDK